MLHNRLAMQHYLVCYVFISCTSESLHTVGFVLDAGDYLVADSIAEFSHFVDSYVDVIEDRDLVAYLNFALDVGNVDHSKIHADRADNGRSLTVYHEAAAFLVILVEQLAEDSVRVAYSNGSYLSLAGGGISSVVAYGSTSFMLGNFQNNSSESECRLQVDLLTQFLAGVVAVEHIAGANHVVVNGVLVEYSCTSAGVLMGSSSQNSLYLAYSSSKSLGLERSKLQVAFSKAVGAHIVHEDAVELEVSQLLYLLSEIAAVLNGNTQTGSTGINFNMDLSLYATLSCFLIECLSEIKVADSAHITAVEYLLDVSDDRLVDDHDIYVREDTSYKRSLLCISNSKVLAVLENVGDDVHTTAVSVSLYHRHDVHAVLQASAYLEVVVLHSVYVNIESCRAGGESSEVAPDGIDVGFQAFVEVLHSACTGTLDKNNVTDAHSALSNESEESVHKFLALVSRETVALSAAKTAAESLVILTDEENVVKTGLVAELS